MTIKPHSDDRSCARTLTDEGGAHGVVRRLVRALARIAAERAVAAVARLKTEFVFLGIRQESCECTKFGAQDLAPNPPSQVERPASKQRGSQLVEQRRQSARRAAQGTGNSPNASLPTRHESCSSTCCAPSNKRIRPELNAGAA